MQEITIPIKSESVVKELYFTKENYLSILQSVEEKLDSNDISREEKTSLYGIYNNAFAGLIRSGQLCMRKDGDDTMPVIEIEAKGSRYTIRESTLDAVLGQEAESIIHPWKDGSSYNGYIKGAFSKKGNTDPENIYSSKDLDAAVKLAESKKDKTMKEMERNYEKDLASAEKDNARLEKKLSETDAGLKRALGTIEELKKRNEETIKNAEEHEKEAVRKAIEGIEDNKEELENTKKELEALHKTSEKNKADYASYREKKEKEEKEREKYTYDPNYDHYYSDILPKVVNTLEFSHTDLLVREGCIFISLLASVIALIYVL